MERTLHSVIEDKQWIMWLVGATLGVHVVETWYRLEWFDTYWSWLTHLYLQPVFFLAGVAFFWGFRLAPTFLMAWGSFITMLVASRVLITVYAGEPLNGMVLLGIGLLVLGLLLSSFLVHRFVTFGSIVLLGLMLFFQGHLITQEVLSVMVLDWWMLYLFGGAVLIALEEFVARKGYFNYYSPVTVHFSSPYVRLQLWRSDWPYLKSKWLVFLPLIFVEGSLFFYGYGEAQPSFIFAWAVYNVYDVLLRAVSVKFLLKEQFHFSHGVGMILVVFGTFYSYVGGIV